MNKIIATLTWFTEGFVDPIIFTFRKVVGYRQAEVRHNGRVFEVVLPHRWSDLIEIAEYVEYEPGSDDSAIIKLQQDMNSGDYHPPIEMACHALGIPNKERNG